jgi:arsenite methyltransferase
MDSKDVKATIKDHYGRIAEGANSCCGPNCGCANVEDEQVVSILMSEQYKGVDQQIVAAADLGLGCGTLTAFTDLAPGMRVLDLGAGAGIDVFIAAKSVGPTGKAIGLDMTDAMLKRARANKVKLGIENAEFWKGEIEDMPVESSSIDRIISNCVINLVPDKARAFAEMYRVLKPGGKFIIADVVSIGVIPDGVRQNQDLWAGCVAGAIEKMEYVGTAKAAGFKNLEVLAEKSYDMGGSTATFGLASITLKGEK